MTKQDKEDILFGLGVSLALFLLFFIYGKYAKEPTKPKKDNKVEVLIEKNDSIKLIIDNLDSIKHAKVIEVSTLDYDSTVKLFYELVRE